MTRWWERRGFELPVCFGSDFIDLDKLAFIITREHEML